MKNNTTSKQIHLVILLSFLLNLTTLNAQVWTFSNKETPSYPKESVCIGDTLFLYNNQVKNDVCSYNLLKAFDNEGVLKWESIGGDIIFSNDTCIFLGELDYGMVDAWGDEHFVIREIDAYGNELLNFTSTEYLHGEPTNISEVPLNISLSPQGRILICSTEDLIVFNPDGSPISEKKYSQDTTLLGAYFSDLHSDDGIYLISSERISILNHITGVEVNTYSPGFVIDDICYRSDTIFILNNDSIFLLDYTFTSFVDTISIDNSIQVIDFKVVGRNIWISGIQSDNKILHSISLDDHESTSTFPMREDYLTGNTDFYINNDQVVITGQSDMNQAAAIAYQIDETPVFNLPDIGISNFEIDNIRLDYGHNTPTDSFIHGFRFDAHIAIENTGLEEIDEVSIYTLLQGGLGLCAVNEKHWTVEDLNLSPGNSTTITATDFYQEIVSGNSDICFSALSPKDQIDLQSNNNKLCKYFPVSVNSTESAENIVIYPIPAKDKIYLEFQTNEFRDIAIYDLMGRKFKALSSNENEIQIQLDYLVQGIYFIQITDKTGTITKKIQIE